MLKINDIRNWFSKPTLESEEIRNIHFDLVKLERTLNQIEKIINIGSHEIHHKLDTMQSILEQIEKRKPEKKSSKKTKPKKNDKTSG